MSTLAIDPSSHLGWASDATGRLEWGTENFGLRKNETSGERWLRYTAWLCRMTLPRTGPITDWDPVDTIVFEHTTFVPRLKGKKFAGNARELAGGFKALLEHHCTRCRIELVPVHPQTLKAFALPKVKRKKGDPKMDRSKAAMIAAAERRLQIISYLTEHEADALWLFWFLKRRVDPLVREAARIAEEMKAGFAADVMFPKEEK